MPYDPQRAHSRRLTAADDEPAPVDALLEPHPAEPAFPAGVEVEVVGEEVVVHTDDVDVEISRSGDDVVVHTDDADVEVRAEADEVVVSTGADDVYVDLAPTEATDVASAPAGTGRRVAAIAATLALLAVLVLWLRRRRRPPT